MNSYPKVFAVFLFAIIALCYELYRQVQKRKNIPPTSTSKASAKPFPVDYASKKEVSPAEDWKPSDSVSHAKVSRKKFIPPVLEAPETPKVVTGYFRARKIVIAGRRHKVVARGHRTGVFQIRPAGQPKAQPFWRQLIAA